MGLTQFRVVIFCAKKANLILLRGRALLPDREPATIQELYARTLEDLAHKHGEDYARATAAETIAQLLMMVSRAAYRLPDYPLYLAPTPEAQDRADINSGGPSDETDAAD